MWNHRETVFIAYLLGSAVFRQKRELEIPGLLYRLILIRKYNILLCSTGIDLAGELLRLVQGQPLSTPTVRSITGLQNLPNVRLLPSAFLRYDNIFKYCVDMKILIGVG